MVLMPNSKLEICRILQKTFSSFSQDLISKLTQGLASQKNMGATDTKNLVRREVCTAFCKATTVMFEGISLITTGQTYTVEHFEAEFESMGLAVPEEWKEEASHYDLDVREDAVVEGEERSNYDSK